MLQIFYKILRPLGTQNDGNIMRKNRFSIWALVFVFGLSLSVAQAKDKAKPAVKHVILISVDGLRPDAISVLGPKEAPAFYEIINNGATTLNARTDYDYTVTLPDHWCMLTSLRVVGEKGHHYAINSYKGQTIHQVKGKYVPGIFDVTHEHGLRSAFFSAKSKFMLYIKSYGAKGMDRQPNVDYEGKYLIDAYRLIDSNDDAVVGSFLKKLSAAQTAFLFLHVVGVDKAGHAYTWNLIPGSEYMNAVKKVDGLLGKILQAIRSNKKLADSTAIIITADHGGIGNAHRDSKDKRNYTIPFLVWGKAVAQGADLYRLNPKTRKDPGKVAVPYDVPGQPIRNGDAANLALSLLGLPAIPGSTINSHQDLNVFP